MSEGQSPRAWPAAHHSDQQRSRTGARPVVRRRRRLWAAVAIMRRDIATARRTVKERRISSVNGRRGGGPIGRDQRARTCFKQLTHQMRLCSTKVFSTVISQPLRQSAQQSDTTECYDFVIRSAARAWQTQDGQRRAATANKNIRVTEVQC